MNSTPAEVPVTSSTNATPGPPAKAGAPQTNKTSMVNRMDLIVDPSEQCITPYYHKGRLALRDNHHLLPLTLTAAGMDLLRSRRALEKNAKTATRRRGVATWVTWHLDDGLLA